MNRICQAEGKWGSSINEESEEESSEAQLGGGPGAHTPLAPERGAPPPAEWKERKNGENQYHVNKKTNRVIVEIYYS